MASNPDSPPQATHRPPAHHRRRIRMFFFPIIAQPVPPHPAEPGRASHWIRRFLGRTPTEPAKPFKLLNQVLGSSPSLPLEISRDGFYHKPVRVCSPLVIPRLYLESVHPKACREDLQESTQHKKLIREQRRFSWVLIIDSKAMLQKTVLLLALVAQVLMLENGLLRTPPMGWLAWERFRCNINCDQDPKNCISERLFMEMADRLAQDGWRDLGYVYLNIDDCWIGGRDARGRLMPDPNRFPHGIAFLADYAHSLGLKLGIYEDMGKMTCMGYPGTTLDKVELDAETFAEWKVDMLKLDGCFSTDKERAEGYPKMAAALNATGRPIAFSCSWPAYEGGLPPKVNYTLLANICNLWRNYDDIQDSWKSVLSIVDWFVKHQDILQPVAGPGHWNDPDMLLIGNFGLSFEESKAQMALWTILAAPLFMSTDLRTISPQNIDILQNPLMIKINQDRLGIAGRRIFKSKSQIEVFKRRLSNEASALVFFSRRTDMPYHFHSSLLELKFPRSRVYEGQNVFTGDVISGLKSETNFTVIINPSGVVMWYLYPIKSLRLSTH